MVNPPSFYIGQ